jgi:hypothetical protein
MTLPQPAHAGAQPIRIAGTQGLDINLRTAPGSDGQVIGNIPEGASPDYFCFKHGQSVNGVDLWFWVAWEGQKGYYSGFYDTIPPEYMNDAALWQHYGIGECEKPVPSAAKIAPVEKRERRSRDTPDSAGAAANYGPDHGSITAVTSQTEASVTFRFQLNSKQLENLRRLGEYLELDFALTGYNFSAGTGWIGQNGWDGYWIESNIPGAVKDVSFEDTDDRLQHPAITGIRTEFLEADVEYRATMLWDPRRLQQNGQPAVNVGWAPSHWASRAGFSVKENNSCALGITSGNEAAWCVFPNRDQGYSVIGEAKNADGSLLYPEYANGYVPIRALAAPVTF